MRAARFLRTLFRGNDEVLFGGFCIVFRRPSPAWRRAPSVAVAKIRNLRWRPLAPTPACTTAARLVGGGQRRHSGCMVGAAPGRRGEGRGGRRDVAPARPCAWAGCTRAEDYRAPKSRAALRDFQWFCLEHARTWNANQLVGGTDYTGSAARQREAVDPAFLVPVNDPGYKTPVGPPRRQGAFGRRRAGCRAVSRMCPNRNTQATAERFSL